MSTTEYGDGRPKAVRSAEAGATAWSEAVAQQHEAPGRHADFYALAAELAATLYALNDLTVVLAAQVGAYGQSRVLYDNTHTVDPAARLVDAVQVSVRGPGGVGTGDSRGEHVLVGDRAHRVSR